MIEAAALIAEPDSEPRDAISRRCVVTGEVRAKAELVRFAVDPGGRIVPDVAARLPGRGLWITARRDIVEKAVKKRLFARAAKAPAVAEPGLEDLVESLLARRAIEFLGLARRAGLANAGFVKVKAAMMRGGVAALVEATDGAARAADKLGAPAPGTVIVSCLDGAELGAAFGREHAVHVALKPGRLTDLFLVEARRLAGFRAGAKVETKDAVGQG